MVVFYPKPQELAECIRRAKSGHKEAFGKLYHHYSPKIYRFLFFNLRDRHIAEDVAQLTFLKLWRNLKLYDEKKGSFAAFLFSMARNLMIDWQRKRKTLSLEKIGEISVPDTTVEQLIVKQECKAVREAVARLPHFEKRMITLRFFENFSYKEISHVVKKHEGAIRVRVHRVLKELKRELSPRAYE
jgi:RNA polymerase sigma-70 factor (ECF subfamily)